MFKVVYYIPGLVNFYGSRFCPFPALLGEYFFYKIYVYWSTKGDELIMLIYFKLAKMVVRLFG